ncbi:MAG TPA: DUF4215 domain-containing protein [Candidatus Binatia bacterium]|nr:DUF4215 domain-containing protein [Candidatus Binatia bacterium]
MRIDNRAVVTATLVVALGGFAPRAWGADSKECKASRKCRGIIASHSSKATSLALTQLDKCHAKRDAGKFTGDCNAIDVSGIVAKSAKLIGKKCTASDPVRCFFTDCDPVASITKALSRAIKETGETVQGSPTIAGDKQRAKCHKAVGLARSKVVRSLLKPVIGNQKLSDFGTCEFNPLSKPALAASESFVSGLRGKIAKACAGLIADDIGSCSPFPDCVFDSAQSISENLVVQFYGSPAICGDGVVTPPNEECDDGNEVDEDACSNSCRAAVCGDNITQTSEECDDDSLDENECVQCKAARCGDGFLWTENLPDGVPAEQCDDGNDVADDGCTNCTIDAVSCDPLVGYRVTVAVAYDQNEADLNAITVDLTYPVGVSIPGSAQEASVQARIVVLGNPSDFFSLGNDRDLLPTDGTEETLTIGYASLADSLDNPTDGVPPGDQLEIRFDCAAGARFSGEDFGCKPTSASTLSTTLPVEGPDAAVTCSVRVSAP